MNDSGVKDFCRKKLHLSVVPVGIPGCGIYSLAAEVTPKLAADWLDKFNPKNRDLRDGRMRQHAADMSAERWLLTHQGIAFDETGEITSGQHRLNAVVLSGKTVRFVIFLNCPQEERAVIDQTAARSARDVASLAHGEKVTALSIAVCRTMKYGAKMRATVQMTPQETYAFFQEHRTAIKDFMAVLMEGMPKSAADKPIILLRNWLLENRDAVRNTHGRSRAYARTEAALAAYLANETPARLHEPEQELFPIKGDSIAA